jgi:hypothetical protein
VSAGHQKYSDEILEQHKQYLLDCARRCAEQGVKYFKPILARGRHIGEMVCKAAEQKGVDFLVVGRRGMNRYSRLLTGSTSKYCMVNAPCNVIITKGCYLPEEHGSRYEAQMLEEQERLRRMKEEKPEEHTSSRDEIRDLEELERTRRLREREDEASHMRNAEHEASLIKRLKELEEERLRRGGTEMYTGKLGERIDRLQQE